MDSEKEAKSLSQMRLEAEQLGLTSLAQLAETLGVDEDTILRWENANSIPFEYYKKWQTALGVSNKPANVLSATRIIRIRKTAS
jgi:transcriptional regulator with XRE-family HTH domain